MAYEPYIELAERLNKLAPGDFAKKTMFLTTGAEAVENAIKIARAYTKRPGVIAFTGGYHGRTMMGMALTGKVAPYKMGFGPFPGEIYHAPFPQCAARRERRRRASPPSSTSSSTTSNPRSVAAIIIEPVQGEGGFYVAPPDFMQRLRKLCDQHGILLIADEVQTGAGRTGKFFAMEQYGVAADMMTMAK